MLRPNLLKHFSTHSNRTKTVILSRSHDIFTNLALEDWLYQNNNFANHRVLLLWQNDPCVVIGRHQNPWLEANVPLLLLNGIKLARRNSGGGTVYHDKGNLNMTFFTTRDRYKRRDNLEVIAGAISKTYGLRLDITKREDLAVDGLKISGTAAKLGRQNAYHHCTMLVDVNKRDLSETLRKTAQEIETTATKSIRSDVVNLRDKIPDVTVENLARIIGREFLGSEYEEFASVDPLEGAYPGIDGIKTCLEGWEWVFGRTPKFKVSRTVENVVVNMVVEKGVVSEVSFVLPRKFPENLECVDEILGLRGCKYTEDVGGFVDRAVAGVNRDLVVRRTLT